MIGDEIIERDGAGEIDPEGARAGGDAHAVVAAGEADPAIGEAPDDLADGERDHQEAQAPGAERERADDAGEHGAGGQRAEGGGKGREMGGSDQPGIDVGRHAEEGGLGERDHAAVAEQHVEAECEEGEDEDLAGDRDVEDSGEEPGQDGEEGRDEERGAERAGEAHWATRPKRPSGLTMRAMIIGRKRMT